MSLLRECPFCASDAIELREFTFPNIDVAVITCKSCGGSMSLPAEKVQEAWNLRKKTDRLLMSCLPILRCFVMLSTSHRVNADQEIALINEIAAHLAQSETV
jgi:hypothetical protein